MKRSKMLAAILALAFISLGILLAAVIIIGIWTGFETPFIGKSVATLFVLFLLNGVLYSVAKGMDEEPEEPD